MYVSKLFCQLTRGRIVYLLGSYIFLLLELQAAEFALGDSFCFLWVD